MQGLIILSIHNIFFGKKDFCSSIIFILLLLLTFCEYHEVVYHVTEYYQVIKGKRKSESSNTLTITSVVLQDHEHATGTNKNCLQTLSRMLWHTNLLVCVLLLGQSNDDCFFLLPLKVREYIFESTRFYNNAVSNLL
jgi:hypothetical protein